MSPADSDQPNPYQSPVPAKPVLAEPAPNLRLIKLIRDFRSQMVALGALWMIIGGVALAVGLLTPTSLGTYSEVIQTMLLLFVILGIVWISLGVLVCCKQMWAVSAGLVLSYLSLIGNLLNFNLCGLVILVVAILQAHRVLGWAKQIRASGVPLTARPEDFIAM